MKTFSFSAAFTLIAVLAAADQDAGERKQCEDNLKTIYEAIQSYRKDHKQLPPYLHSLVPVYIADKSVFRCRSAHGKKPPCEHLRDTEMECDYAYAFSATKAGAHFLPEVDMTMAEASMLQMSVVGGAVPIVRCQSHAPVINISFDGVLYGSPVEWGGPHQEKLSCDDLSPKHIRARILRSIGNGAPDRIAFELLEDDAWGKGDNPEEAMIVAAKAADFLRQYPESEKISAVIQVRSSMLYSAGCCGNLEAKRLFKELAEQSKNHCSVSRMDALMMNRMVLDLDRLDRKASDFERGIRRLIKDFPDCAPPYQELLAIAQQREQDEARKLIEEVIASDQAPEEPRQRAKDLLRKLNLKGTPLTLKFTALDGREVDVTKMRGKVVLIDFWATTCSPCVADLPNLKRLYDRFHDKGLEVIGINFDKDRSALERCVQKSGLAWPQFFDGKGWDSPLRQQYFISSIPAMWLVSKEGKIADLQAHLNPAEKVERLLNEASQNRP